ncbi:DEAD/DEAH box helicase family protein [Segatella albensis]|nr:DEAD/DEAH box helicase family protein [Segatella albensis]
MYHNQYISKIDNAELVQTINVTSASFIQRINENFDINRQLNALLLGNVQSGKTAQMLGIISAMADEGYKIFLLLTTDNVDLHRQTYNRVKNSLSGFNVLNEKEESLLTQASLIKPTVVVLKKNSRVLSRWKNHLLNTNICKGLFLVIFDDEADASSLNTLVNKDRVSTINKRLSEIKASAANTIYIEVTATPQAVILQTSMSGWRPKFVYYFKPGDNYLGGNYFYPKTQSLNTIFTPDYELDSIIEGGDVICPIG